MKIEKNILEILSSCEIKDNVIFLPNIQLERKIYEKVNKCLLNIGGKWNKKIKGHIFDTNPTDLFENLLLTGNTEDIKKTFQFFPTPDNIGEIMCKLGNLEKAKNIIEPSCGKGNLADIIYKYNKNLTCVELNHQMLSYLKDKPYKENIIMDIDFLNYKDKSFDRVIMNPPFSKQQDIDHIYHAYDLLEQNGILVSIISVSPFFRQNKKSLEFIEWLNSLNTEIIEVESGAFKESGTMVPTKIIKIIKG